MTDNAQSELDKLHKEVEYCVTMEYRAPQGEPAKSRIDRLMSMFTAQTNKQVGEVLDRLLSQATIYKAVTHNEFGIPRTIVVAHAVPESAIEAERTKLEAEL